MLDDLGAENIAEDVPVIIDGLSFEEIFMKDPDAIFISLMGDEEAARKYMEELLAKGELDMLVFMLTNIIGESSILLFKGARGLEVMQAATNSLSEDGETVFAPGMVSRKKQLIPQILAALQQ